MNTHESFNCNTNYNNKTIIYKGKNKIKTLCVSDYNSLNICLIRKTVKVEKIVIILLFPELKEKLNKREKTCLWF